VAILNTDRVRRRSTLLLIVFGVSLMLVAATAAALVAVVSGDLTTAAIESSVRSDRSLVSAFTASGIAPGDLRISGVEPARTATIERQISAFIDRSSGIVHVKVFAPDGTVLYSERTDLRGQNLGVDEDLAAAIAGRTVASSIVAADAGEAATTNLPPGAQVLEEYIPIVMGGGVPAVFEIYRDARPILAAVDLTRRDVLAVTLAAAFMLGILLYLIFHAAQRRLTHQTEALLEASRRDALTGLLNHGSTVAGLADALEHARRDESSVGIALIDIDNFRLLNETHGHGAGDRALIEVARTLRLELSSASLVGRYGPDEFLIVAPPECAHDLEPAIERLRGTLSHLSLQFGVSERLPVTVSAGICYSPKHGEAATELLAVATVTLGEAKASGGNGVRVASLTPDDLQARERSSFDVLTGLISAVDTKDRYTQRHSEDVARYALFIADRIDLDPQQRRSIEMAGLLHDVGKIGIPDGILRKPGPLTADEYGIVKQHVALGDAIVRDVPYVDVVRAGVRHHHERWDGTGYLDGLAGDAIPLIARILAVADAFSAMTTSRPYRQALSVQESLHRLEDAAGSQLDPWLVSAFVAGIETASDAPLPGDGRPLRRLWTPASSVA
jgi:diguanylate cyclase (GGDEF)-like protein